MLEAHMIRFADAFALFKAGNNKLANIAMMAMTTSNSMSVKAENGLDICVLSQDRI